MAVSGQQLSKHVPIVRQVQQLDYNNERGVLYMVRAEMLWAGQFEATSSVARRWLAGNGVSAEAGESPLLETFAREPLVKTQQAGKGLAYSHL
jgi:hypothetical protein